MKEYSQELIDKQLLAYNNHDIESLLETYSEAIEFRHLNDNGLVIKGHEGVREYHSHNLFNRKGLEAQIVNRIVVGDKVIDHEYVSGLRGEVVEAVTIYEVKENKITRIWCMNAAAPSS